MVAVRGQALCLAGFLLFGRSLTPRTAATYSCEREWVGPHAIKRERNMKKIVPDPPSQTSPRSFYTIDNKVPSPEALLYAIQLMRGIEDTLDEYICGNAGEPGIGMLVNSVHNVQMSRALAELVLAREP